jgi:MOSC domain-containing protein
MRVAQLYVYPVKGCRALAVDQATLGPLGFEHDRSFAFVGADGRAVTQRDQPLLATVCPTLDEGVLRLDFGGLTEMRIPLDHFARSTCADVWGTRIPARAVSADNASDYLGMRVALVMLDAEARRSFADSKPVLVTTKEALSELNIPGIGMDRFRPNVVLDGHEQWRELRGRDAVLEYVEPCGRCEVTTIDQASGARSGAEPLRSLNERFAGNFGIYCRVARGGCLRRGEALIVA